jgi:cysteinyl-tRNA synthetase
MEFNDDVLKAAEQGLTRIKTCYENLCHAISLSNLPNSEHEQVLIAEAKKYENAFVSAMDDDFNTADAITAIFELVTHINRISEPHLTCSTDFLKALNNILLNLCGILGLELAKEAASDENMDKEIEALIAARQEARKTKNFAEADRIRDEIANMGYILEDTPQGVRWRKER